jgi:hypothetical protein
MSVQETTANDSFSIVDETALAGRITTKLVGVDTQNNPHLLGDFRKPLSEIIQDEIYDNWDFVTIPKENIEWRYWNGIGTVWVEVSEAQTFVSSGQQAGQLSNQNTRMKSSKFVAEMSAYSDAYGNYHHYETKLIVNMLYKQLEHIPTEAIPAELDSLLRYVKLYWRKRRHELKHMGIMEITCESSVIVESEDDPSVTHATLGLILTYVKVDI